MTTKELIKYCLTCSQAFEDYPFGATTAVMRHKVNRKMFALINNKNNTVLITLKCDPIQADFLRQVYKDVRPGYHMNKTHWNTIHIDGDLPKEQLYELIQHSYNLIKPKNKNGLKTTKRTEEL